ncbi:TPA: Nucleolar protein 58, variant 2 [Trebouxia sp. C0004]
MKRREEQLEAWKAKRTKPLAAISNSIVLNRPPKPPVKRLAVLNKGLSAANKPSDVESVDKENQQDHPSEKPPVVSKTSLSSKIPRAKQGSAGSSKRPTAESPAPDPVKAEAPIARKAALSASSLINMENQYDMLKGTLDTLKRESIRASVSGDVSKLSSAQVLGPHNAPEADSTFRPAIPRPSGALLRDSTLVTDSGKNRTATATSSSNETQPVFELGGRFETRSLAGLATELFKDPAFMELCDKGLNGTLQRTKDGATAESRIQELAALVKLLRRCVNQMTGKTRQYVDTSIKFEREASQQVESVQLASESAHKQLELELANAKHNAAQAAAAHKSSAASWQGELDWQKSEVSRLQRELDRMEAERDRAREDARRAASAQQELEGSVNGLKKETGAQLRELASDRGEALRALEGAKQAAEHRQHQLQDELQNVQARAQYAESRAAVAEAELQALRKQEVALQEAVAQGQERERLLLDQHQQAQAEFEEQQRAHEQVVGESSNMLIQFNDLQARCTELLGELEAAQVSSSQSQGQLQAALQDHQGRQMLWETEKTQLQGDKNAGLAREAVLLEGKCQLKAALSSALESKAEVESALQTALQDKQRLRQEAEAGSSALATKEEEAAQLQQQLQQAESQEVTLQEAQAAMAADAAAKAGKLAHLEGELEALQGVMGTGDQTEVLGRLVSRVATLEGAAGEAEAQRRALHNQLVELRGNIRVFCRVRPGAASAVVCLPDGLSVRLEGQTEGIKDSSFAFDKVFGGQSSQAEVFAEVSDMVQSALDGYKVCLFSYGQTGAGKTHTMQGTKSGEGRGIIPRAILKILEAASKLGNSGWEYAMEASFIEVYNETLRDLLGEGRNPREPGKVLDNNAIKHMADGSQTVVQGATRLPIGCAADAEGLVKKAAAARAVESTAMNAVSSRSHSVFTLYITGRHEASGQRLQGALNLVDLAGSERLARSQVEGKHQKEACSINKSLSSLGDVFSALASKQPHVPYRNSKLTHLLQPCLGGDGKTLMFVNINCDPSSVKETLCSLRFAAKVNQCETGAKGGARKHITQLPSATDNTATEPSAKEVKQHNDSLCMNVILSSRAQCQRSELTEAKHIRARGSSDKRLPSPYRDRCLLLLA